VITMRDFVFVVMAFGVAACSMFGPAERATVEKNIATVGGCEEVGRACQADGGHDCYAQYDACTRDAGLR
jgi:hypothetical protein